MANNTALSRLHYELMRGLIENGRCPINKELASSLNLSPDVLEAQLRALAEWHGVVLHPSAVRPWIIHPFSLTPTVNWIEGERASWWAPCIWCAFGVATLVGGEVTLHTRFGAESEPLQIRVQNGSPVDHNNLWVHFAIPPAQAWNNVHEHCSMVLPFRQREEIDDWSKRHGLPRGEAVELDRVAQLARIWYGSHASPSWRKWSVAEAQSIFSRVALTSYFWNLGEDRGRF